MNKEEILKLRKEGLTYGEIVKKLNVTKSIVAYYCNENRFDENKDKIKEKSKLEYEQIIINFIKDSNNINQVCKKLNIRPTNVNYLKINKIIDKYNLNIDHFCLDLTKNNKLYTFDEIFCKNSLYKSYSLLKNKLIKLKIKEHKCEKCNNAEWLNEPIPLELHHIDGIKTNLEIDNLQLLCPNCHAQTDNYTGKNVKNSLPKINGKELNKCINCNKETKNKLFCSKECQNTFNLSKLPTKEEIINKFKELKTYTAVSKFYKISDKGLVKWCAKLNLPEKRKEMDSYLNSL